MNNNTKLRLYKTLKFQVLGLEHESPGVGVTHLSDTTTTISNPSLSIFLDINDNYTRQVIASALRTKIPKVSITFGPGEGNTEISLPPYCKFQWSEYERIDWSSVLAGKHCASSYCVRKGISRKAQLAHYTRLYTCKHPNSILKDAIPTTVILDTWSVWDEKLGAAAGGLDDILTGSSLRTSNSINRRCLLDNCLKDAKDAMLQAEAIYKEELSRNCESEAPVWILKPSTINKAEGIEIVHLYEQLVDICWRESNIREWVLQRYIDPPLLLGKRKFHIRAYVLAVSALKVYFFRDCLALCCGRRYQRFNTSNKFAHLTNTAYQDRDPSFVEEHCVRLWDDNDAASILFRDGTCKTMEEAKERVQDVIRKMEKITGELFEAYKNEFGVFAPISGCFEHFGFDFIVAHDWKVSLLEVNPGPDFKQTGSRLSRIIEKLMCDTIDAVFLEKSGKNVGNLTLVYDAHFQNQDSKINMRLI
jgi:tubulin---tyrosine ligase